MTATLRTARVAAATAARRAIAAPSGLLLSVGLYFGVVAVLGSLWRTASNARGGSVAGYSAAALTWYVATSEAATIPLNTRLIEAVGDDIASGHIAVELLRPASVLLVRVASELGRTMPHLAACLLVGVPLAAVAGGGPPSPLALVLVVPSLVLALACNIVGQHAFAAVAFWVRDARSTWFIYQKVVFIVGGMLLPLEVLPATLTTIAKDLPFMAMAYAPARLASGHLEPSLLALQVGWLAVLSVTALLVFQAGERRLQVVGG